MKEQRPPGEAEQHLRLKRALEVDMQIGFRQFYKIKAGFRSHTFPPFSV